MTSDRLISIALLHIHPDIKKLALLTKSLNVSLVRLGVLISSCNIPFKISWTSALFLPARYASAGIATAEMSVRPSVCLSVSSSVRHSGIVPKRTKPA